MSLLQMFHEGGFIMYPLLVFCFLMVMVVFEKFWVFTKFKNETHRLQNQFAQLQAKATSPAFDAFNPIVAAPYVLLLSLKGQPKSDVKESVIRQIEHIQEALKGRLWILGTIASSAPFIGLFGTVLGIIKSFGDIAEAGKSGFAIVAAGLSEALIATAAGIIVAVIAVLFFNFLKVWLNKLIFNYRFTLENQIDQYLRD